MGNPRKAAPPKFKHGSGNASYTGTQVQIGGLYPEDRAKLVQYVLARTAYSVGRKPALDPSGGAVAMIFPDADVNAAGVSAMSADEAAAYGAANPRMAELVDQWVEWAKAKKRQ